VTEATTEASVDPDPSPHPRSAPGARETRSFVYQDCRSPKTAASFFEPSEVETRKNAQPLREYVLIALKLYEDISQHGAIATGLCLFR